MKKYLSLLLFLLLSFCIFADEFELKKIDFGNYTSNNMSIESWNDCTVRITDEEHKTVLFHPNDMDTVLKISKFLKDFLVEKNIFNTDDLIAFFDSQNIKYFYKNVDKPEEFYISSQSFLEDFLVPNYGFPSGFNDKNKKFLYVWDKENCRYKNRKLIFDDRIEEQFNDNGEYYESIKITYNDYIEEYFGYNGKFFESKKITYDDKVIEFFNPEKTYYLNQKITYKDRVEENSDYNGKFFETTKITYDDKVEEYFGYNGKYYKSKKITFEDEVIDFFDANDKYFNSKKITLTDGTEKIYSEYNAEKDFYNKLDIYYPDGSKAYYRGGDSDYWETKVEETSYGKLTGFNKYNKELGGYEEKYIIDLYKITSLSNLQKVTLKDGSTTAYYTYIKTEYVDYDTEDLDYYTEESNSKWNMEDEVFEDIVFKSSNLEKRKSYHLSNYDSTIKDYKTKVYLFIEKGNTYVEFDCMDYTDKNGKKHEKLNEKVEVWDIIEKFSDSIF